MIGPHDLLRGAKIVAVLLDEGLDEFLVVGGGPPGGKLLFYSLPWNWIPRRRAPLAVRVRRALERLGPIFVKFGQILSTRRDLLSEEIATELVKLQDQVPPFQGAEARRIVELAYAAPLDRFFRHFDEQPLASASVAQVHLATLLDGRDVVLKVLRPGVARTIRRDIALLRVLAAFAHRLIRDVRRLRLMEVVSEFERVLADELDLIREGSNAAQLRRNFANDETLYVPEVYWAYTRPAVLALERIDGIPIDDIERIRAAGVDMKLLAETGVRIFFTQVFVHNFFHADMHPGNIFVSPQGQYRAVDFGIVGSLDPADQSYLAANFVAFFNRDYRGVALAHKQAGWIHKDTRTDQFESAIRAVCEPIFAKPLREISLAGMLVRLFTVARRFDMEIQPQLVLLQKTLLNIEGLGRQIYPELDLWQTAQPFLEHWVKERVGWRAFAQEARAQLPQITQALPKLPMLVYDALQQIANANAQIQRHNLVLEQIAADTRGYRRSTVEAILGTGLMAIAALLHVTGESDWLAQTAGILGLLLLIRAWLGVH